MEHPRSLRRYHYKVYFPQDTLEMCKEFFDQLCRLNVTYHAAYQMCDDPRSIIILPIQSDLTQPESKLIEFYENLDTNGNTLHTIQKIVIRVSHLNKRYDYTYLVAREGFIVSAWCSEKTDNHRLTRSLFDYYCPANLKQGIYKKIRNIDSDISETIV